MKTLIKISVFIVAVISFTIYNNTSFKKLVLKLENNKTTMQVVTHTEYLNGSTNYFTMDVNNYNRDVAFKTFASPSVICTKCYLK